jgi:hypothetical protein
MGTHHTIAGRTMGNGGEKTNRAGEQLVTRPSTTKRASRATQKHPYTREEIPPKTTIATP